MNDPETQDASTEITGESRKIRFGLCRDFAEMLRKRSEELEQFGFSTQMARFECLMTAKLIVDELFDELNVGQARHEWYREFVQFGPDGSV